jgi:hypothetical protein
MKYCFLLESSTLTEVFIQPITESANHLHFHLFLSGSLDNGFAGKPHGTERGEACRPKEDHSLLLRARRTGSYRHLSALQALEALKHI